MGHALVRRLPLAAALLAALPAALLVSANAVADPRRTEVAPGTFRSRAVTSAANCGACHTRAVEGSFREREIRVPR